MVGARLRKKIEVVLCKARDSFLSTMTSFTDSALSSPFFSISFSVSTVSFSFSMLGDLDFSLALGDFSGVLDLDLDFDLRRDFDSSSSSELEEDELDDEELDEEPGGATNNKTVIYNTRIVRTLNSMLFILIIKINIKNLKNLK